MKVRCIANRGIILPQGYIDSTEGYSTDMVFRELTPGKEYVVYLITSWKGETWYFISDDALRNYPSTYPAPLFEVSDHRLSASWQIDVEPSGVMTLAFAEWFADPYYYDKLTDLQKAEVANFQQISARMDAESSNA
jgi:hypothetical protein